jgi:pimeloyl-ACP methyl ester carboxylesterase
MLTIVLLSGMDGTGSLFEPFIAALGPSFHYVIVRYPTTEGLGYAELEEIARRSLPKHGSFIILGESFSGPIAVSLASSHPIGLVGLVLCSTFIRSPRPALKPLSVVLKFLPVKSAPSLIYSYFLLGPAATAALESSIKVAVGQISAAALRARLRAVLSVDVSSKMKKLLIPVLYLKASQDRLVPPSAGVYIADTYPKTQVISVDAPHFLLQVASDEAARVMKRFVREECGI